MKGDVRMADVIAAAVEQRQRIPDGPRMLNVEGHQLVLRPHVVAAARAHARRNRRPHNLARVSYVKEILDGLASQYARLLGVQLSADNRTELLADLRESPDVRREVNLTWMPMTPQSLLEGLYAEPHRLADAAPHLDDAQRALLARDRGAPWTVSDIPLLDEAAELLGDDDTGGYELKRQAAQQRQAEIEYAKGALQISGGARWARQCRGTCRSVRRRGPDSQRCGARRGRPNLGLWACGRRRGAGVVGDGVAAADAAVSGEVDDAGWRYRADRFGRRCAFMGRGLGSLRRRSLATDRVDGQLPHAGPGDDARHRPCSRAAGVTASAPRSVRDGDVPPTAHRIPPGDVGAIVDVVRAELDGLGEGRLAVIAPAAQVGELQVALATSLPVGLVGDRIRRARRAGRSVGGEPGEGPGVRHRGAGRASPHSRRVGARRERPVCRPDPPHPATADRAQRTAAGRARHDSGKLIRES